MIKVDINGIDFTSRVEIDLSFVEKLNRELDEGYISIPHSFRATPFSMFDIVDIYEDETLLFSGRISMDRVSVSSFNDRLFNHEIHLVEHTKILEKYIVKGKTFTKSISLGADPAYTLLDVVEIIRETTPLEVVSLKETFRPFKIPQETIDLLDNVIAPEFNFKDLTLRQALDQVASVIDSIVRLDRNGNLLLTQFDKLKDKISFIANDYKISQNINDYSTTIESEMLNSVMGANDLENTLYEEIYPSERTFTTLRSNDYLFGFENLTHIPTPRPIYKVNDVRIMVFVFSVTSQTPQQFPGSTTLASGFIEISIANRVLPFEVWNTLDIGSGVELIDRTKFFKNNTFYYRYGQKNIYVGESFGLFGTQTAVENTIKNAAIDHFINIGIIPPEMETWEYEDENEVLFRIQGVEPAFTEAAMTNRGLLPSRVYYTPIPRAQRFQVERDTISEVNLYSETIVNQQTRLIDVEKYGNNLKGRINQMGNSVKQLSHRVGSPTETFDIGDFIQDNGLYVITQKEVIIHRDYTIANYELTRNFNNFSQFMGVDKEIRQSEVGEANRTVERDLIYKEYIEIDVLENLGSVGKNTAVTLNDTIPILRTLDKNFEHDYIKFGYIETDTIDTKILVGVNKLSGGNTFGLSFELENNVSAGNKLVEEEGLFNIANRSFNEPVRYADTQARFENLKFYAYHEEPDTIDFNIVDQDYQESDRNTARIIADEAPIIDDSIIPQSPPIIEGEWYVSKDNREVIKFTLLYPFLSSNHEKVIVGNKLVELNGLNRKGKNNVQLWVYENRRFDSSDVNKSLEAPDIVYDSNLSLIFSNANQRIIIDNNIPSGHSWALVDDNGFPYLMSNTDARAIIFNFVNKREDVIYSYFLGKVERVELSSGLLISSNVSTIDIDFEIVSLSSLLKAKTTLDFDTVITEFDEIELSSMLKLNNLISFTTIITDPTPSVSLSSKDILKTTLEFETDITPPSESLDLVSVTIIKCSLGFTANPTLFTVRAKTDTPNPTSGTPMQWGIENTSYNQTGTANLNSTSFTTLRTDVPFDSTVYFQIPQSFVFNSNTYVLDSVTTTSGNVVNFGGGDFEINNVIGNADITIKYLILGGF